MPQGNFQERSRTYHEQPATSATGYTVTQIVDAAYRRLNEPSLFTTSGQSDRRLDQGILSLRGLFDTMNGDATLYQPSQFVSYVIPVQPTLTWGVGGWDIDDQPPLQIKTMWLDNDGTNWQRDPLVEMSAYDLAEFRNRYIANVTSLFYPTRYYLERTWPVMRLHLDIEDAIETNQALTERDNRETLTWTAGNENGIPTFRGEGTGFIRLVNARSLGQTGWRVNIVTADDRPGEKFFLGLGGGQGVEVERQTQTSYAGIIRSTSDDLFPEGRSSAQLFEREGGPPLEFSPRQRRLTRLNAFVVKALTLPENPSAAANFVIQLPPGYFEYILTGLAIRLSSLSSKPLPDAVVFANQHAKYAITSHVEPVEPVNDLKFLTPRRGISRRLRGL